MKKTLLFGFTIAMAVIFSSCSKSKEIALSDIYVCGIEHNIEALNGTYTLTKEKNALNIDITFETTQDTKDISISDFKSIEMSVSGDGESPLRNANNDKIVFTAKNGLDALQTLIKGNKGTQQTISFEYTSSNKDVLQRVFNTMQYAEIYIDCNLKDGTEDSDFAIKEPDVEEIVVKEPVAEKVTSTVNIDQLLDSYDQYVDKYIAVMKKANAGDINAISDMSDLLQSTQDFESKLNNVSGDFSTKQLARYTRITNKMTKAAL